MAFGQQVAEVVAQLDPGNVLDIEQPGCDVAGLFGVELIGGFGGARLDQIKIPSRHVAHFGTPGLPFGDQFDHAGAEADADGHRQG